MADLFLRPRVAPSDRLRCWLGGFGGPVGALQWTVDDVPASAGALRPMQPLHTHGARASAGVFEFTGITPGRRRIGVREAGGGRTEIAVRTMPAVVPEDNWLRIQLISCYHRTEDGGHLAKVVEGLTPAERPDFSILMGDQVYLDLPTLANFPDNEAKLARRFEEQYTRNWRERRGLASVLAAAPSVCAPDDHEYWNNFPHAAAAIQNSWTAGGRARWRRAASALFDSFQVAAPTGRGESVVFDVDPVSFLVLDQRSERREDLTSALTPGALDKLDEWVQRLIDESKYGVVVSGQPFLDKPAGRLAGKLGDRTLPNYGDYGRVVRSLTRLADAGRPVILLTGDAHWGRVTTVREGARILFYEVICSPAALVSFVGVDQVKTVGSAIRGFFGGARERWPRHSDPGQPPAQLAREALSPRKLSTDRIEPAQKGDQLATLCLRRSAGGLEMKVIYREVHKRPIPPVVKGPWRLRDRP